MILETPTQAWATAAEPPPLLTVSQWADSKRMLPETSAGRGAPWRTETTPYLRGIMDVVHEPGVRKVALKKCNQSGGSEALHNIIGYHIEHDPCAILFVHPTARVADEWSKERLADMLRTTPALRTVVRDKRTKRGSLEGESTLGLKIFPGGYLATGGANTPNTFARRSVRRGFGDDVDRWPPVVGEEGDPTDLLVNRGDTFYDFIAFFVSTPTLKGGRIDTLYERSDQRRYFITCPHCGRDDWIAWNDEQHFRVVFDERDPDTARLECPSTDHGGCGAQLSEVDRRAMIVGSVLEWQPTAKPQELGLVGFHLPAMLSTLGGTSLSSLVENWLGARARGKESLRVFINTKLAEGWEDRGARMDANQLFQRREDYGEGIEVPLPAVVLTAGVDVQHNRFVLQVMAWGLAYERWLVDYRVIPGDPKKAETQAALLEALKRKYTHALGLQLPILTICIDTGYATEEMYDFVLAHEVHRIYATKGVAGRSGEPIVGKASEKRRGPGARPVRLYPINVDDAKADIYSSLALLTPGPSATHHPLHLDSVHEEYFAGLCSEHRETRYNKAGVATHTVWVQDRAENEPLDCSGLCLAGFRILNPNIRQMADLLADAARQRTQESQDPPQTPSTPATPANSGRRVSRSSYLER